MKFTVGYIFVIFVASFAAVSAEDGAGYFIPKAFYTLDAEGHKTQLRPLSSYTSQHLRRLRRQVYSSSSASSSSSVSSSNGGPVYFSTQNMVSQTPSGSVSFSSRFGEGVSSTASHSGSKYSTPNVVGSGGVYGNHYNANDVGFGASSNYDNYGTGYGSTSLGNSFGSSAASRSSVSSNGGPVYFNTQQSVSHTPAANVNFASRFGVDDTPATVSKTITTSGVIDNKGVVHYKTTTSHHG